MNGPAHEDGSARAPLEWLLEGEPWIEYRTRLDLLGQSEKDPEVRAARKSMTAAARIRNLVAELSAWPGKVIASHKSAGQPFHKLTFIADLGLKVGDPGVDSIVDRIMEHRSADGPFQLPVNTPAYHGGSGREQWAWALCDAPLTVYALVKFGLKNEPAVEAAAGHLAGLARDNGWPCAVSRELGAFRGPGRREDPCPFATLAMLKALSEIEEMRESKACRAGAEALLALWSESRERHPYMFYMGTDFRKLKVPFVWYDLMHFLDVLSRFPWLGKDARMLDMIGLLKNKADRQGRFTLESHWTAWKDWEFGRKREPSRWLTLLAWRTLRRNRASNLETAVPDGDDV
jgi:hypothetical protein